MKRLIQYFINYSIAADVIVVLLLIFGVVGLTRMLATYFPESPDREINVNLVFPGASPAELEEGVVTKIEDRLKGVTGIEKITSSSKENSGTIRVFVLHGHDADEVLQDVKNAVDGIASFPAGLESPTVYVNENHDLAISFALSGGIDLRGLKKIARDIENELRAEPGISQIELSGFPEEEIEISVREDRLRAYQLTFSQISEAVRKANLEVTGGTIKDDPLERLIRAQNKAYYASDLQRIFIKATPDGQVVRLEDVAFVRDQWADKPARSFYNGQPAVVVTVRNTSDEDILFITDHIKEYIAGFNATHDQVQANVINDQSKALRERIDLLINNGLIGFALVLILLALFLNIRLAFWVAIAIPVSFTGMFIVVSIIGVSINVISLFAMIVVIGILVDDGIVISENIYRHYENGMPRMQAAIHGTMEVLPPVLSAILTTIIAFSTFLFIDGRLGDFFSEMAIVVMATLAFSLIEGAIILPAHVAHSKALSRSTKRYRLEHWMDSKLKGFRDRYYSRLLQFCLQNKFLTVSLALALLFTSFGVVGGGFVKTTFFPFIERESIDVDIRLPAGTREHVTEKWLDHIEASSWAVNEALKEEHNDTNGVITAIEKKLGPNTYEGKLNIILLEGEKRTIRSNTIAEAIRKKSGPIPGAEKASFGGRSAFGRAFSISLLSDNLEELELVTEKLKQAMRDMTELRDVSDNNPKGLLEVKLELKDRAYLMGLNLQQVISQVRQGFFGDEIQRLQRGIDEVKVWVRYEEADRASFGKLENMRIRTPEGTEIPLKEIASLREERGVIAINHLNNQREITVEADAAHEGVSVSDITSELKNTIVPGILKDHAAVSVAYEGQNREQEKSRKSMGQILPIILILMFAMVVFTFRSFSQSLLVFLLIPLGFIGVVLGHWFHGHQISLFSILGLIALIGIIINDSLVLIGALNVLLKEGKSFMEAVYEASVSRFRPILLTSITTIAGLAPLILEKGFQAQFLVPMAITIAYGLLVGTLLLLIVLPVLLVMANRFKIAVRWLWTGTRPTAESVERAVREINRPHAES